MITIFQTTYQFGSEYQPVVNGNTFKPLIVIGCSMQVENIKTGVLDEHIEIETTAVIPNDATNKGISLIQMKHYNWLSMSKLAEKKSKQQVVRESLEIKMLKGLKFD